MAPDELALCICIDAAGWSVVERHPDFLQGILTVRQPLTTVFGSVHACNTTILTGKLPQEHGQFAAFRYAPTESPFARDDLRLFALLPRALTSGERVRKQFSKRLADRLGYSSDFSLGRIPLDRLPLFDYTEQGDLYQTGNRADGITTLFDSLRAEDIPFFVSDRRLSEGRVFRLLEDAIVGESRPRLAYLSLTGLGSVLRSEGMDSETVSTRITEYDHALRHLLTLARDRYKRVRLFVFSNQGATPITDTCALQDLVDRTGLRFGEEYVAFYDSTIARFWFLKPSARETICRVLKQEARGEILDDSTLREWGCDFPDCRYGELLFLLRPGVLLVPSFEGETRPAAATGFAPNAPGSVAFFGTNVESEKYWKRPKRLDDLYAILHSEAHLGSPACGLG